MKELLDKPNRKGAKRHRLTPIKKIFADEFLKNGGNAQDAYIKTRIALGTPYNSKGHTVAKVAGYRMLQDPLVRQLISKAEDTIYAEALPTVKKLKSLRETSEDEKTQLGASNALMDAFFKVVKRMDEKEANLPENLTQNIIITNMSTDEILERIDAIAKRRDEKRRAGDAVPGVGEKESERLPDLPDAGVSGVQEPGSGT